VPRRFQNRPSDNRRLEIEQLAGSAIGEANAARCIDDDEAFDHALEESGGALRLLAELVLTLEALLGELAQAFGFQALVTTALQPPSDGKDRRQKQEKHGGKSHD
jgi:hypothetical protein